MGSPSFLWQVQAFGAEVRYRYPSRLRRASVRPSARRHTWREALQVATAPRVSVVRARPVKQRSRRRPSICVASEGHGGRLRSATQGEARQRRAALGARPSASVVDRAHRRDDDAPAGIRARPIPLHSGSGKSVAVRVGRFGSSWREARATVDALGKVVRDHRAIGLALERQTCRIFECKCVRTFRGGSWIGWRRAVRSEGTRLETVTSLPTTSVMSQASRLTLRKAVLTIAWSLLVAVRVRRERSALTRECQRDQLR
jgi:hypothetical protein